MESDERQVSILFADICDSTPLYEQSGDEAALALIAESLDELASLAQRHGGEVIRSKGDDVLCTFEVPGNALDAAAAMAEARGRGITPIHVGIHHGPVIRARQDVFGDAVNVAARMLALAKPGEVVASRALVEALPPGSRDRLSSIGSRSIAGKQGPVEVFSMVLDEGDATQIVWGTGSAAAPAHPHTVTATVIVELHYRERRLEVGEGERCLLGRADRCDLVIADPCVSREHASVEVFMGRASLIDRSSTGSWILDGEGRHTTLRRVGGALRGTGKIRLGRHPRDPQAAPELAFTIRELV